MDGTDGRATGASPAMFGPFPCRSAHGQTTLGDEMSRHQACISQVSPGQFEREKSSRHLRNEDKRWRSMFIARAGPFADTTLVLLLSATTAYSSHTPRDGFKLGATPACAVGETPTCCSCRFFWDVWACVVMTRVTPAHDYIPLTCRCCRGPGSSTHGRPEGLRGNLWCGTGKRSWGDGARFGRLPTLQPSSKRIEALKSGFAPKRAAAAAAMAEEAVKIVLRFRDDWRSGWKPL